MTYPLPPSSGAPLVAPTIFFRSEWSFLHLDHLYKMLIFNRVIEKHMENFKNLKLENWAK